MNLKEQNEHYEYLEPVPSVWRNTVQYLGERRSRRLWGGRRFVEVGVASTGVIVADARHSFGSAVRPFREPEVNLSVGPDELDDFFALPVVGEDRGDLEPLDLHGLQHGHVLVVVDQNAGRILGEHLKFSFHNGIIYFRSYALLQSFKQK